MKIEQNLNRKIFSSRYLCIKKDGNEIYTENLPKEGEMSDFAGLLGSKLNALNRLLPAAKWTGAIEQQWKENGHTHYEVLNLALTIKKERPK